MRLSTTLLLAAFIVLESAGVSQAQESKFAIAAGAGHGLLLKGDGTVWTWGANGYGQLGRDADDSWAPARVPALSGIQSIAAGDEFSLALKADGTVWAWGENDEGQLGNGAKNNSSKPVAVSGLPRIVGIAAAGTHAMALDSNGTVWQWGALPEQKTIPVPQQVAKPADVIAIAAGDRHSIALDRRGQVWVWGDHGAGDLGNGSYISFYPQPVPGFTDIVAVAGAYQLTVGLKRDGTVWSVGYGAAGQRGNGTTETSTKPLMANIAGVKAIAARYMNVLAVKADGTVWGWGSNHYGELGNTAIGVEDSTKPVRAGSLSDVAAIASGGNHSAALSGKGVVWTWGVNDRGGLGADPEALHQSDSPMRPGQFIPPDCRALFACATASGKIIRICGDEDPDHIDKWSHIHYRFGPPSGPPDFMYPEDPDNAPPSLFFSRQPGKGDEEDVIRFTNGGYTYRVYAGAGGAVDVEDAKGKRVSGISCIERPEYYRDYLRENLPCDPQSPSGCKKPGARK